MRWLLISAAIASLAAAYGAGRSHGKSSAEAAHKTELLARIEAGQKLEAARRDAARKIEVLSQQLEEQAHEDPVAVDRCLGSSRVRRLNALR